MARNEITFQVNLKKDTNSASRTYGMYFGEAESKEPLNLKGFAKHLTEHGKLTTYEMMVLVLQNIVSCMKELICQGQPVKLEGLGTFYPTIENKKGGVESPEAYDPNVQIEGVHLRFLPEGAMGEAFFVLPDEFITHDAYLIRQANGMDTRGTRNMLSQWVQKRKAYTIGRLPVTTQSPIILSVFMFDVVNNS